MVCRSLSALTIVAVLSACAGAPPHNESARQASVGSGARCDAPAWFGQRSSQPPTWIGYGRGTSETEALTLAQTSIVQQQGATLTASCTDSQVRSRSADQEHIESRQQCLSQASSRQRLSMARVVQRARCGGQVFVAALFDARPLSQRLAALGAAGPVASVPAPLHGSFAAAGISLADKLGTPVSVDWQDGLWSLRLDGQTLQIGEPELWRALRWDFHHKANLALMQAGLPVSRVRPGAELELRVQVDPAAAHATLINIHDNGRVRVLAGNVPPSRINWRLTVGLQPGQQSSTEGYLVVLSHTPLNLLALGMDEDRRPAHDHRELAALFEVMASASVTSLSATTLQIQASQ